MEVGGHATALGRVRGGGLGIAGGGARRVVLRSLCWCKQLRCSKIAEAEAAVSVNEKKWLVMHMHVQLQLDELRGPKPLAHCDMKVPGQLLPFCWAGCCIKAPLQAVVARCPLSALGCTARIPGQCAPTWSTGSGVGGCCVYTLGT
jgi:hypothetical protein